MTSFINPFVNATRAYQRDIDMLRHYAQDQVQHLHLVTGQPLEVCRAFVSRALKPGGQHAFVDPAIVYLQRAENGDRSEVTGTLSTYLRETVAKEELLAPTLTTYVHPKHKQSLLSLYIGDNIAARARAKKQYFVAKAEGNRPLTALKKIEQTGRKLGNNAISGAHVSPSQPLYNKTAHSTLTSVCRTTSGYGNANNEKFLSGNRHYFSHHLVLNNIVSIVRNTDYVQLERVAFKYALHLPSVEETLACICYSTQLYWSGAPYFAKIERLVRRLSALERAAFVYTGDLHHLKQHNDALVRRFLTALSTKVQGVHADPASALKRAPDDHLNLAHLLCKTETQGIGKDYTKIEGTPAHHTLALTVEHIAQVLTEHTDLIKTLWVTSNLPASVAYFPESIRRSAITSDTDSTIFTVQDWTLWYHGHITFDPNVPQIADTVVFLASATITNVLAVMSANFGIIEANLHDIAMKNEFKFDVFVPTQIGKHYFADIACQEGNVFIEHDIEIKGVGLKSSNAPRPIIAQATAMMKDIMRSVREDGSISLAKYLREVADVERAIVKSIQKGESTYLRRGSIKDAASYVGEPEESPYVNHLFWNDVFGEKYGIMPAPPYSTLKVSVELDTPLKLQAWLATVEDRAFALRLTMWMARMGRNKITTLHLPTQCVQSGGLPKEFFNVINYQKIVGDIVKIFYLLLETLGCYSNGDKMRKMISTYY